jgi:hypothetical protein
LRGGARGGLYQPLVRIDLRAAETAGQDLVKIHD